MSGIVKAVSKAIKGVVKTVVSPFKPPKVEGYEPYNPQTDPVYVKQQQQLEVDRQATRDTQAKLEAEQIAAKKKAEAEQRDLAAQQAAKARARRAGGVRSLLSDERLNPERGLSNNSKLG